MTPKSAGTGDDLDDVISDKIKTMSQAEEERGAPTSAVRSNESS